MSLLEGLFTAAMMVALMLFGLWFGIGLGQGEVIESCRKTQEFRIDHKAMLPAHITCQVQP